MASKKRCGLSLKRKLEILDFVESSKKSKRRIADELGVPRATLYDILKEKDTASPLPAVLFLWRVSD